MFPRKGRKMFGRSPQGQGVGQLCVYIFFTGNDLGNRKTLPVSIIGAGAIGKGPTGHMKCSDRENSEILAHLGQDSYRKIIQIALGRGDGRGREGTGL